MEEFNYVFWGKRNLLIAAIEKAQTQCQLCQVHICCNDRWWLYWCCISQCSGPCFMILKNCLHPIKLEELTFQMSPERKLCDQQSSWFTWHAHIHLNRLTLDRRASSVVKFAVMGEWAKQKQPWVSGALLCSPVTQWWSPRWPWPRDASRRLEDTLWSPWLWPWTSSPIGLGLIGPQVLDNWLP